MTRLRLWKTWRRTVGLIALTVALVGALSTIPVVSDWQNLLQDTLFRVAPPPKSPAKVVLVSIDDASLEAYGRWPWSRDILANLIARLAQANAKVIGLDVLLAEPESYPADAAMESALKSAGHVVLVDKISNSSAGPVWIEPLPQFAQASASVGHAQAVLDRDGVCRRFPARELTVDGSRWAFAIEIARLADPGKASRFVANFGLNFAEGDSAVTRAEPVLIPIAFRADNSPTISAMSVLRGEDLSEVKGKPVLIGFGPTGIADRLATPLSRKWPTPGVEVHAQIVDDVLSGRTLRASSGLMTAVLIVIFGAFSVVTFMRLRGWEMLGGLGGILAFTYCLGLAVFYYFPRILPIGELTLTVVIAPLVVHGADLIEVERSVNGQLRSLQSWLATRRRMESPNQNELYWKLNLLQQLQTELGALYELHEALLESTQDLVAIFNESGQLILHNAALKSALDCELSDLTLSDLTQQWTPKTDSALVRGTNNPDLEVYFRGELYSARVVPLPATSLSPRGGTIVTLSSLKAREERDRARAEALGFVTHELRTPLVAIQGFSELMMRYPSSPANTAAPETIFRESKRLVALINSYLDVLRLDSGAKPAKAVRVNVNQIVKEVFDLLRPSAESAGMNLNFEGGEKCCALGDPMLLTGAVLNLVSNALKYGRRNTPVVVRCTQGQQEVAIEVENQGEPILEADLSQLFGAYYRGTADQSQVSGWGLGLAFVKRIAEKHKGIVTARNSVSGVVFEMRLPAGTRFSNAESRAEVGKP
jgi:CHASE2 domain-containing sensor protein/signal transduction histidine kinase